MKEYTCYEYRFLRNEKNLEEPIRIRHIYGFVSSLTNEEYRVLVDECDGPILSIKFFRKRDWNNNKRYNILTNLNEPRNIVFTCINILLKEFLEKHPEFNIAFIGSNNIGESPRNTKRFGFYSKMLSYVAGINTYRHFQDENNSIYALIRREQMDQNPRILQELIDLYKKYEIADEITEQ